MENKSKLKVLFIIMFIINCIAVTFSLIMFVAGLDSYITGEGLEKLGYVIALILYSISGIISIILSIIGMICNYKSKQKIKLLYYLNLIFLIIIIAFFLALIIIPKTLIN